MIWILSSKEEHSHDISRALISVRSLLDWPVVPEMR